MNMKKSTHFKLLIVAMLLITCNNLFAQDPEVIWDFPVKPGMAEWKSLKNIFERRNACQIPDDVLPALSTEQLIEVCLRYPLLLDIWAFDNILTGLDKYSRDFNGFRELIKRNDAALVLIQKYKEENPLAIDKEWSSYEIFGYTIRISMTELFLCNKQMLSKLDHIERKDLMNEYRLKKSQKNKRIELYKNKGFQTVYLAIVKLLESENVDLIQNINMDIAMPYITTGILLSKDVFKEINNAVNNYLLNDLRLISDESTDFEVYSQVRAANVYTPKGSDVTASSSSEGWSPFQRDSVDNYFLTAYYPAIKIPTYGEYGGEELSSTTRFNCHGYAWHVSERGVDNTNEYRWMGNENIYWEDFDEPSYTEVNHSGYPEKISYRPPGVDHSAVVTDNSQWVTSKWAEGPLMYHAPNNCPYVRYYSDPSAVYLKYYQLNPKIVEGSTDVLCDYDERTFETDITHMPVGTLEWTHNSHVTNVSSEDDTYEYTVKGSTIGVGEVIVNINTLTGFNRNIEREFPVNKKPIIGNQMVDGGTYYYGMGICPGEHSLSVTRVGGDSPIGWTVPSGIQGGVGADDTTLDFFLYPFSPSSFTITAEQEGNNCSTSSSSRSFYLTKDWCGYGMTLFPNPASDNVTITMIESDTTITGVATADAKADEPTTYTIRIYNSQSFLLSTWTRSGKNFDIPLINMRDGTYIIEVSDGENSYRQQLFVKHN